MNKKYIITLSIFTLICNTSCFAWYTGSWFTKEAKSEPINLSESTLALIASLQKQDSPKNEAVQPELPLKQRAIYHGIAAGLTAAIHLAALNSHLATLATESEPLRPVSSATLLLTADIAAITTGFFYYHKESLEKKIGKKKALGLGIVGIGACSLIPTLLVETSARDALIETGRYVGEKVIAGTCYFLDCVLQGLCKP